MIRLTDGQRLDLQLRRDAMLRLGLLLVIALAIVLEGVIGGWSVALLLAGLGGWFITGVRASALAQHLPELTQLVDASPDQAQDQLTRALAQPMLPKGLRLQLSHRLALLRRRQGRTDDVAAICDTALRHVGPRGSSLRVHLLLMLAEAMLNRGHLPAAYACLMQCHQARRNLGETLNLLALQTRYELAAGHGYHAWTNWPGKASLAELMPPGPSATVHAMLAQAAASVGDSAAADWLSQRAALLADPAAINALMVDQTV